MSTELSLISRQMRSYSRSERPVVFEHRGESGTQYDEGNVVENGLLKIGSGGYAEEAPGFVSVHKHDTSSKYKKDGVSVEVVKAAISDPELIEAQMNNDQL